MMPREREVTLLQVFMSVNNIHIRTCISVNNINMQQRTEKGLGFPQNEEKLSSMVSIRC